MKGEPARLKELFDAVGNLEGSDMRYYQKIDPDNIIYLIRVGTKDLVFDLEASRREQGYLRQMLE